MKNKVFNVWVSTAITPTDSWEICHRLMVNQFRVSERGLGKGSLTLFAGNSSFIKTGYLGEFKPGLWVKITKNENDEGDDLIEGPSNVLFIGFVDTASETISLNAVSGQNQGYVTIKEMGWKFAETVLNSARDVTNVEIREGDVFNPIFHGKIFYNKEKDEPLLTRTTTKSDHISSLIYFPFKEYAWTRYDVIQHIATRSPYNLEFSLDESADQNSEENWPDLLDFVKRSYPNMDDQTIGQALDNLLPDPYSWHFNYSRSLSSLEIVICSKNIAPIADIPAGQQVTPTVTRMKGMEIINHQRPVDQLTYQGARILITGTFTTLDTGVGSGGTINKTMDRDWTNEQRDDYKDAINKTGVNNDPYVYQVNEQYRQSKLDMVYQKYKFIKPFGVPNALDDVIAGGWSSTMYVTDFPGERDSITTVKHFFPILDLSSEDGLIPTDSPSISASVRTQHATPAQFNMILSKHLGVFDSSTSDWRTPIIAYHSAFDKDNKFWYSLNNAPKVGLQQAKVEVSENGIQLRLPYPELLAKDDLQLFTDSDNNPITVPLHEGWETNNVSRYNPAEIEVVNNGNWQRMIFTLAYRSDQRLEWSEHRKKLVGITVSDDGLTSTRVYENTPVIRSLVIKDDDLELYYNHKGTVYDLNLNGFVVDKTVTLLRLHENTITRNDFPILIKKCKQLFANMSLDRRAMVLTLPLDEKHDWMQLGKIPVAFEYFNKSTKTKYSVPVNTPITSIEYSIEGGEPSCIVTTDIPNMPMYSRVLDAARSE